MTKPMSTGKTAQVLAAITDAAGKTVKSPLDGFCFVRGANPPHLIAVHHTITARDSL